MEAWPRARAISALEIPATIVSPPTPPVGRRHSALRPNRPGSRVQKGSRLDGAVAEWLAYAWRRGPNRGSRLGDGGAWRHGGHRRPRDGLRDILRLHRNVGRGGLSKFAGQISGLSGADAIDLADLSFNSSTEATFLGTATGGTLTITNGAQTEEIALKGDYLSSTWTVSSDGAGGTSIVDPVASTNWQMMKVGAGGFADGLDIDPDGTMVVRTDTNGAYLWNGTSWQQLVTSSSMPAAFLAANPAGSGQGVYEIQMAPSNSNIMYMMFDGYVFSSANKGTTWTQTSFAQVTENANDSFRMDGQKMAVDPNNPNIVYVGTPQNGLWVTTNGGQSWSKVSAIPVSESSNGSYPGITGILFDPAIGGVVNGVTQTIFASSYGNGVYESTNGGSTWTKLSGGPSDVQYAAVSSTGAYYATDGSNSVALRRRRVDRIAEPGRPGIQSIAINPNNPNEIVTVRHGWLSNVSYNGGATWSGIDCRHRQRRRIFPGWRKAQTGERRRVSHVSAA